MTALHARRGEVAERFGTSGLSLHVSTDRFAKTLKNLTSKHGDLTRGRKVSEP
jgi:hypothetical protein